MSDDSDFDDFDDWDENSVIEAPAFPAVHSDESDGDGDYTDSIHSAQSRSFQKPAFPTTSNALINHGDDHITSPSPPKIPSPNSSAPSSVISDVTFNSRRRTPHREIRRQLERESAIQKIKQNAGADLSFMDRFDKNKQQKQQKQIVKEYAKSEHSNHDNEDIDSDSDSSLNLESSEGEDLIGSPRVVPTKKNSDGSIPPMIETPARFSLPPKSIASETPNSRGDDVSSKVMKQNANIQNKYAPLPANHSPTTILEDNDDDDEFDDFDYAGDETIAVPESSNSLSDESESQSSSDENNHNQHVSVQSISILSSFSMGRKKREHMLHQMKKKMTKTKSPLSTNRPPLPALRRKSGASYASNSNQGTPNHNYNNNNNNNNHNINHDDNIDSISDNDSGIEDSDSVIEMFNETRPDKHIEINKQNDNNSSEQQQQQQQQQQKHHHQRQHNHHQEQHEEPIQSPMRRNISARFSAYEKDSVVGSERDFPEEDSDSDAFGEWDQINDEQAMGGSRSVSDESVNDKESLHNDDNDNSVNNNVAITIEQPTCDDDDDSVDEGQVSPVNGSQGVKSPRRPMLPRGDPYRNVNGPRSVELQQAEKRKVEYKGDEEQQDENDDENDDDDDDDSMFDDFDAGNEMTVEEVVVIGKDGNEEVTLNENGSSIGGENNINNGESESDIDLSTDNDDDDGDDDMTDGDDGSNVFTSHDDSNDDNDNSDDDLDIDTDTNDNNDDNEDDNSINDSDIDEYDEEELAIEADIMGTTVEELKAQKREEEGLPPIIQNQASDNINADDDDDDDESNNNDFKSPTKSRKSPKKTAKKSTKKPKSTIKKPKSKNTATDETPYNEDDQLVKNERNRTTRVEPLQTPVKSTPFDDDPMLSESEDLNSIQSDDDNYNNNLTAEEEDLAITNLIPDDAFKKREDGAFEDFSGLRDAIEMGIDDENSDESEDDEFLDLSDIDISGSENENSKNIDDETGSEDEGNMDNIIPAELTTPLDQIKEVDYQNIKDSVDQALKDEDDKDLSERRLKAAVRKNREKRRMQESGLIAEDADDDDEGVIPLLHGDGEDRDDYSDTLPNILSHSFISELQIPDVAARIPTFKESNVDGKNYTVFQIIVKMGSDIEWIVYRRFSSFERLHSNLRSFNPDLPLPKLPPKLSMMRKSKVDVQKRRIDLQMYLAAVLHNCKEFVLRGPMQLTEEAKKICFLLQVPCLDAFLKFTPVVLSRVCGHIFDLENTFSFAKQLKREKGVRGKAKILGNTIAETTTRARTYNQDLELRIKANGVVCAQLKSECVTATGELKMTEKTRLHQLSFVHAETDPVVDEKKEIHAQKKMLVREIRRLQKQLDDAKKHTKEVIEQYNNKRSELASRKEEQLQRKKNYRRILNDAKNFNKIVTKLHAKIEKSSHANVKDRFPQGSQVEWVKTSNQGLAEVSSLLASVKPPQSIGVEFTTQVCSLLRENITLNLAVNKAYNMLQNQQSGMYDVDML
eukprot:TRINITY_DN2055_c2_g1_i1.p1 TRINITY_DN2055_c2_g1~~TRINITY_DN2055_c2_g1_i1.p1  ORF type:complete len:1482 (-),score=590.18 TRINITY_DN2055_c2_g1_i1:144-4589(-)